MTSGSAGVPLTRERTLAGQAILRDEGAPAGPGVRVGALHGSVTLEGNPKVPGGGPGCSRGLHRRLQMRRSSPRGPEPRRGASHRVGQARPGAKFGHDPGSPAKELHPTEPSTGCQEIRRRLVHPGWSGAAAGRADVNPEHHRAPLHPQALPGSPAHSRYIRRQEVEAGGEPGADSPGPRSPRVKHPPIHMGGEVPRLPGVGSPKAPGAPRQRAVEVLWLPVGGGPRPAQPPPSSPETRTLARAETSPTPTAGRRWAVCAVGPPPRTGWGV